MQVPSAAPVVMLHAPPQHSTSVVQVSPTCVQYDGALLQTPFLQKLEQQSLLPPHVLPDVLHDGFSGAHVPPEQTPPQHSPSALHALLSDVH